MASTALVYMIFLVTSGIRFGSSKEMKIRRIPYFVDVGVEIIRDQVLT